MSDPAIPSTDPPLGDPPQPSPPTPAPPGYDPSKTPLESPPPDLPTTPDDQRPYGAAEAGSRQMREYGVSQ